MANTNTKKGNLFIMSGPSGVGKNAVEKRLRHIMPMLEIVTTYTTRQKRPHEKAGKAYHFISKKRFKQMIKDKDFIEWAKVHKNYYGTPREDLKRALNKGGQILIIIDVQGALQIKKQLPKTHMIFLQPQSISQLRKHLKRRIGITDANMELRLKDAQKELKKKHLYSHHVTSVEGRLNNTTANVAKIIKKIQRQSQSIDK